MDILNNRTMKFLLATVMVFIGITHLGYAQQLPEDAKRILDKLAEYEEREKKATEEEIVKDKKKVIKSLERSERRIKSEGTRRFFNWHINRLKSEVASSERVISGAAKKDIVDYDAVYHYKHPMDAFSDQKGELVFNINGKVHMRHRSPNGETLFAHDITWALRDGKLVIIDQVHGDIIVSQKQPNKPNIIMLEWTKMGKTITAMVK
jgi:hypothetical protein